MASWAAAVMVLAYALLRSAGGCGGQAPDSAGDAAVLLILESAQRETAEWYGLNGEALQAARLALCDYLEEEESGDGAPIKLMEGVSYDDISLGLNKSVIAVLSAECTNYTCTASDSHHGKPVVSISPSCLANVTTAGDVWPGEPLCMLPSLAHLPRGIAGLLSHYKWERATVVTEADSQLVLAADDVKSALHSVGITEISQFSLFSDSPLTNVLHRDYRIVILNSTPLLSRLVLCEAVRRNLTRHVWITPGWYPHGWWRQGDDPAVNTQSTCSDESLEQFLVTGGRTLSLLQSPPYYKNTSEWEEFQVKCVEAGLGDCAYGALAYDAVWAVLDALNTTSDLTELDWRLDNTTFDGATGQVRFEKSHRVLGGYTLGQMRRLPDGTIGDVSFATLRLGLGEALSLTYFPGESEQGVWPDGVPPDGSPEVKLRHPITGLVVVCTLLSGIVIVWAIICIIFNLWFRKKKLIKLTSPTLNMMIAAGIILINLTTPLILYPPSLVTILPAFCIVRSPLLPIGWTLSLCTISVKMWRVFIIYRSIRKLKSLKQKKMRKLLQDQYMVTLILCILALDVIVIIIVLAVPETRFMPGRVRDKEFPPYRNSEDIEVIYENIQCVSEKGLIWIAILIGYKMVFLTSGVALAILTRKVTVKGLNESREVQVTMLATTPFIVGGLIVRLVLSDYLNVVGALYALTSSIYGALVLGIIFLPKMIGLWKDPSGAKVHISKYHPDAIARERSFTNSSVSFDPTYSLRSIIRKGSVEGGLGLPINLPNEEETKNEKEKEQNSVSDSHDITLPGFEEGTGSNGQQTATDTSDSVVENKFFLIQQDGGSSPDNDNVVSDASSPPTFLRNFNYCEDGVVETAPSQVEEATQSGVMATDIDAASDEEDETEES